MNSDSRQDGNAEDTMKTIRDTIELATEDVDLDPFTETVEDRELDELLGSSDQSVVNAGAEDTGNEPSTGAPRGVGIDVITQEVAEKIGPEAAQVVKDLQAEYTRSRQSLSEERKLREELNERFDSVNARLDAINSPGETDNEDDVDLSSAITDDHRVLFRLMLKELGPEWAEENGYVRTGDLEDIRNRERAHTARRTEMSDAVTAGIERYGEAFGSIDSDGKFELNANAKAKMVPVYTRLTKNLPEGVQFPGTVLDVFEITFGGDENVNRNARQDRLHALGNLGADANGSASGTNNLAWYKPGESLSKTIRKASALSSREART